ncbi:hypothetical protein C2G38_606463 [Gigaspora rosea]|uniref:NACHT domain-containing protein n=1 Tax=Gigaspora rosea TaxID=44941 RepID=A0A397WD06_9GLOM|nr:hypothetical protein C2G38_606463 [Gigaspora rosea]
MPQSPIPLFIALARIGKMVNQDTDLIEIYLKEECNLPIDMINNLRNEKFVFILDGYDEIVERDCQCYERNRFNEWNAKVIISCRPEYLGSGYEKMFFPKNGERGSQELMITPFSKTEIQQYIKSYVNKGHSLHFDTDAYLQQIKNIPQLEDLISNPILLKITLIALPDLIKREASTALQINRINLYEEFLKTWFDRAQQRLLTIQQIDEEKKAFGRLNLDDFSNSCLQFSKDFAAEMFKDNNKVVIEYNSNNSNWEPFLGNEDAKRYLLRFSMPLIRRGTEYWFLHKSIRDYLIAMKFLESFKSTKLDITFFYKQSFASEPGVQQFVAEHIQQKMPDFKPKLLEFIESSKKDEHAQTASANAITILTLIGVQFINLIDLNGCNISGADLNNRILNDLQLAKAKLNQVNFQNVKLQNANLLSSSLQDANFKDADLTFANLQNTLLQVANFQNTTLQNANLQNANLQNVTFQNANFQNADLQYAKLPITSLRYANFKGANLSCVDFYDINTSNGLFFLGQYHEYGIGVEKDNHKAFIYYQKSAEMGHVSGTFQVGYCYDEGIGVEKNKFKATTYYRRLETEHANGIYKIGHSYANGIEVEKDEHKAFICYQKSASMGDSDGTNSVGECYLYGEGVEKDEIKAFAYYQKAAEMGSVNAICNLGECYQNGIGAEKDLTKAFELYLRSANLDLFMD